MKYAPNVKDLTVFTAAENCLIKKYIYIFLHTYYQFKIVNSDYFQIMDLTDEERAMQAQVIHFLIHNFFCIMYYSILYSVDNSLYL